MAKETSTMIPADVKRRDDVFLSVLLRNNVMHLMSAFEKVPLACISLSRT